MKEKHIIYQYPVIPNAVAFCSDQQSRGRRDGIWRVSIMTQSVVLSISFTTNQVINSPVPTFYEILSTLLGWVGTCASAVPHHINLNFHSLFNLYSRHNVKFWFYQNFRNILLIVEMLCLVRPLVPAIFNLSLG